MILHVNKKTLTKRKLQPQYIYVSDLGRTRQTWEYIVKRMKRMINDKWSEPYETYHDNEHYFPFHLNVHYDTRIRELAKGIREQFPKSWTVDEILEERRRLGIFHLG